MQKITRKSPIRFHVVEIFEGQPIRINHYRKEKIAQAKYHSLMRLFSDKRFRGWNALLEEV